MENQTLKLNRGDRAPQFTLTEAGGEPFSLADAVKEGSSLLLIFYHGADCQVCEKQLGEIQENLPRFEDRGIRPVAISRLAGDKLAIKEHVAPGIQILADDGTVAEQYGLIDDGDFTPTLMIVDRHGVLGWIYGCQCQPTLDW